MTLSRTLLELSRSQVLFRRISPELIMFMKHCSLVLHIFKTIYNIMYKKKRFVKLTINKWRLIWEIKQVNNNTFYYVVTGRDGQAVPTETSQWGLTEERTGAERIGSITLYKTPGSITWGLTQDRTHTKRMETVQFKNKINLLV